MGERVWRRVWRHDDGRVWRVWRHGDGSAGFDYWRRVWRLWWHIDGRVWRVWRNDDGSARFDRWHHFARRLWRVWRHDDGSAGFDDWRRVWRLWWHVDSRVWRVWRHDGCCPVTGDTHSQKPYARAAPGSTPHDAPHLPGYWFLAMNRAVCDPFVAVSVKK